MKKTTIKQLVALLLMLMTAVNTNAQEKKAYVWYDWLNNTLIFYYDTNYYSREGRVLFIDDDAEEILASVYSLHFGINQTIISIEKS